MTVDEPDLGGFMEVFHQSAERLLAPRFNHIRGDFRLTSFEWVEGARAYWLRNERIGLNRFMFRWGDRLAILEVWPSPFGGGNQSRLIDRDAVSLMEGRLLGLF